jgi:hypothetical protein
LTLFNFAVFDFVVVPIFGRLVDGRGIDIPHFRLVRRLLLLLGCAVRRTATPTATPAPATPFAFSFFSRARSCLGGLAADKELERFLDFVEGEAGCLVVETRFFIARLFKRRRLSARSFRLTARRLRTALLVMFRLATRGRSFAARLARRARFVTTFLGSPLVRSTPLGLTALGSALFRPALFRSPLFLSRLLGTALFALTWLGSRCDPFRWAWSGGRGARS